jgi:hypothetical protein
VRVRDLVAYNGQDNPPVSYSAAIDDSVCVPHATTTAVPLSIYFIAVPAAGSADGGATTPPGADGVPALYQTTAALVGPFEPQDAAIPPGDMTATTLTVTWLPQGESTIQGYNIYFQDQGIGGTQTGVVADASPGPGIQAYCQTPLPCDGGISDDDGGFDDAGLDDGGYDDASTDGSADGGTTDATVHDAGPTDATLFDAGVADATLSDADAADSNASAGSCDGGRSDAMVQVDAAALLGLSDAALAEMGCIITGTENKNPPPQNNGLCVSGPLSSVFTVDGGTGSLASGTTLEAGTSTLTTVTDGGTDSGDASTTGTTGSTSLNTVVAETAGISNIPWKYLSIYQSGATTASYTVTGLTTGHQYAIGVAAVDSYGNTGPVALGCSTPTAVNDFYSAYTTDGGKAGGGFCSLSAVGSRTGGACVALSLAGLVVLIERRRRRTGRAS